MQPDPKEYWYLSGARADADQADEWRLHVEPLTDEEAGRPKAAPRRMRGNQDYSTLHTGRGTRWTATDDRRGRR